MTRDVLVLQEGGCILVKGPRATLAIISCTIASCFAEGKNAFGGAMYAEGRVVIMISQGTVIANCSAISSSRAVRTRYKCRYVVEPSRL